MVWISEGRYARYVLRMFMRASGSINLCLGNLQSLNSVSGQTFELQHVRASMLATCSFRHESLCEISLAQKIGLETMLYCSCNRINTIAFNSLVKSWELHKRSQSANIRPISHFQCRIAFEEKDNNRESHKGRHQMMWL